MQINLLGRKSIVFFTISTIVAAIILNFHKLNINITERDLWKAYYYIEKILGFKIPLNIPFRDELKRQLNDRIIKDPELLKFKIRVDMDETLLNYRRYEKESYIPNMKNENILKELQRSKYSESQRLIVENAVYYEGPSDGSSSQNILGATMGIRGVWATPHKCENE